MVMTKRNNQRMKGQGLVEFALILPLLLLLLLGIFEFGRVLFIYSNLFNAAREGARYGITSPRNYGGISTRAQQFISMVPVEDVNIWVWYDSGPGTATTTDPEQVIAGVSRVNVQVQYDIEAMTPLFDPFINPVVLETTAARTIQNVGLVLDPPPTVPPPGGEPTPAPPTATPMTTPTPPVTGQYFTLDRPCYDPGIRNLIINAFSWHTINPSGYYYHVFYDGGATPIVLDYGKISEPNFTVPVNNLNITPGEHTLLLASTTKKYPDPLVQQYAVTFNTCPPTPTPSPTPTQTPTPTPTPIPIADIIIQEPVVMGATSVMGTAEPGEMVTLRVVQTGLVRTTTVAPDGYFRFDDLPALEGGMTIIVQGYGKQDSAIVQGGTATPTPTPTPLPTGAYITLSPDCGPAGNQAIVVRGFNWPRGNYLAIYFDGVRLINTGQKVNVSNFVYTINVTNVAAYTPHEVRAEAWTQKDQGGSRVALATMPFHCPCPVPDLVVSSLELVTTPPLGTYRKVDFSVRVRNQGGADIPSLFWVDLYEDESPDPLYNTSLDYIAINGLPAGASIDFTMWVDTGFATTGTHTITVLADTWKQIREYDELNNLSAPLGITVTQQNPIPTPTPTPEIPPGDPGIIQGTTYMDGVPQNLVNIYIYDAAGRLRWSGFSRAFTAPSGAIINGYYEAQLPPGDYLVVGQVRMANALYRGQAVVNALQSGEIRQEVDINLTSIN